MKNNITLTKDFFFGGAARFTVESEKSGDWRTYRLGLSKPNPRYPNPQYMLALLAGPDNENDFVYIGIVNPDTGELRLTRNSRRTESSPDVLIFRWLMKHLFSDGLLNNGKVHHEGKCGCCGRTLTVPESIERGIGPECWRRNGGI